HDHEQVEHAEPAEDRPQPADAGQAAQEPQLAPGILNRPLPHLLGGEDGHHHERDRHHGGGREEVKGKREGQLVPDAEPVQEEGRQPHGVTASSPRCELVFSISISKLPVLSALKLWVTVWPTPPTSKWMS